MNAALVIPDNLTGRTLKVVTTDFADGNGIDLSKYYKKTQTSSDIQLSTAFNGKQDKLTNTQLSAIDYSISQMMTKITFQDGNTASYRWDGFISKETMVNAGLINESDVWQETIVDVKLGSGVVGVTNDAFKNCTQLSNISFAADTYYIGQNAFSNCQALRNVKLPDNLSAIGQNAFSGCASLANLEIPKKVTNVGANAFINCDNLTALTFVGRPLSAVNTMYYYPFGINEHVIDTKVVAGYDVNVINGDLTLDNGTLYVNGQYIQNGDFIQVGSHCEGADANEATGDYAHAEGQSTQASGNISHAGGYASSATAEKSYAIGHRAKAKDKLSYVWQGKESSTNYESNGVGTYNINPKDGIEGFFIDDKNLKTIINETVVVPTTVAEMTDAEDYLKVETIKAALQIAEIDSATNVNDISLGKVISFIKALAELNPHIA